MTEFIFFQCYVFSNVFQNGLEIYFHDYVRKTFTCCRIAISAFIFGLAKSSLQSSILNDIERLINVSVNKIILNFHNAQKQDIAMF